MTEFQFAFLCIFALSIVIMIAYSMHRDRQEETTIWTTGLTTADQEEDKPMPVSYTLQDFDPELGGGQTALEFARAYSRTACLAAEQMTADKAIPGESKKDQAVAVLRVFLRAQGYDPEEEDLSAALPYLIDAAVREESKPLF